MVKHFSGITSDDRRIRKSQIYYLFRTLLRHHLADHRAKTAEGRVLFRRNHQLCMLRCLDDRLFVQRFYAVHIHYGNMDTLCLQKLRRLSGRRHTDVSGVTLRTADRMHTFSAESGVWFRPLSEEEISYYLDTFAPYDKAGSYGIQEWIGYAAIEKINGSFYNVMGLPIQKVYVELEKFLQ